MAALVLLVATLAAACGGSSGSSSSSGSASPSASASTGSAASTTSGVSSLVGAGSTLVAPLVSQWQPVYDKATGVAVTYGAIGSGGGIAQITARTVDFGASDAPLTSSQFTDAKGVVQIPWALAATVIAYHVNGVPNQLKLTGPVLADIWLGKIKTWNDPAIATLNPGVSLPSTKITPVYRTDGSGDTYAFTDYLSRISSQWKSQIGNATQVNFPVGLGGKGNSGVGGVLASTNGAIAYIAIAYVMQNKFDYALVQNAAGQYPVPGIASISAAAAALTSVPADNKVSIVDPPASAPGAYPISTFTYAIVPASGAPKAPALKAFLSWAITSGQQYGAALDFAPLPAQIVTADEATIATIH
ncbi:MAG: phosphate ABC transporter substrate-binding protein PstS [Thermoleophilia bacterium]